jgi:hypothetical protein
MKRILFTLLASTALLAAVPTVALARHDGHHRRQHHARVRHERFGRDGSQTTSAAGQNAGTVSSLSGGVLVITLSNGSMVSGAVTNATQLECEAAGPAVMQTDDQGPGSVGSGDNGDRGGDQGQGDNGDRGDQGDQGDQGDEHMCTTVAPGMTVRQAELTISSAGAAWSKVELTDQP